jgi:hypothetical protein
VIEPRFLGAEDLFLDSNSHVTCISIASENLLLSQPAKRYICVYLQPCLPLNPNYQEGRGIMNDSSADRVVGELSRTADGLYKVWRIYMMWYTWFFGANLLAMTWVFTRGSDTGDAPWLLCAAWLFFNLLAIAVACGILYHTSTAGARANSILRTLSETSRSTAQLEVSFAFPVGVAKLCASLTAVSLVGNVVLWTYLIYSVIT